jgi:hypothetical protein
VIYIGFSPPNGEPINSYQLCESQSGFSDFGEHEAIVEIIVTERTSIPDSAQHIGTCAWIRPACSSPFTFHEILNSSAYFLTTDQNIDVTVTGSLDNAELSARGPSLTKS